MNRIGRAAEDLLVGALRDPALRLIFAAGVAGFFGWVLRTVTGEDIFGPVLPIGVGVLEVLGIALAAKTSVQKLMR
jgi:hypothetical protein